MNSKSTQIKQITSKIDLDKIANYHQEYPKSSTLKEIIRYRRTALNTNDDQLIFKMGVKLAYNLDKICDPEKVGCAKDEKEKKYWLEISKKLFENTVGIKK
jgi:hypothetical protein